MIGKTYTIALSGIEGYKVEVQTNIVPGLPRFQIVGLPDAAIDEAKARIKSAIHAVNATFPNRNITVNLSPASVRKSGTSFDLPIAISILLASQQLSGRDIASYAILGELNLDGSIRSPRGLMPMVMSAKKQGLNKVIVPEAGFKEVACLDGVLFYPMKILSDITRISEERLVPGDASLFHKGNSAESTIHTWSFDDVRGHAIPKRALAIALAGRHNCLLSGPPGSGKTIMCKAAVNLLSPVSFEESVVLTSLYSIAGLLPNGELLRHRPIRSPHHTSSTAAMVGGGSRPKPGEISLAHTGILFLDEIAEFSSKTLEVLRQPMEDRQIMISRANESVTFPSDFILIGTMNPCPCGFLTDQTRECTCTAYAIERYKKKLSGPLLDRIDIHLDVPKLAYNDIAKTEVDTTHNTYKTQIASARERQNERYNSMHTWNGTATHVQIEKEANCTKEAQQVLRAIVNKLNVTGRSYFRLLKVARTIADMALSDHVEAEHIEESLQFRSL